MKRKNDLRAYDHAFNEVSNEEKRTRIADNVDFNILDLNAFQTSQFSSLLLPNLMSLQLPNMLLNQSNIAMQSNAIPANLMSLQLPNMLLHQNNSPLQSNAINHFNNPIFQHGDLTNDLLMGLENLQQNLFSSNENAQKSSPQTSVDKRDQRRISLRNEGRPNEVDPSSFLDLAEKFKAPTLPANHSQGTTNRFQKLSRDVWAHYLDNLQDPQLFRQKIELWGELERVLRKHFNATTHVFGSTLNGFGSAGSDMDICMYYNERNNDRDNGYDKDTFRFLGKVRKQIRRECGRFISGNIELVPAKIPILKFYDHHGKIEVDLSCNNQTSIRNTNLLFCYSQMDWRVRPLVLAVKDWAKAAGINEARFSTLSSYCLTLMVLHFLQAGVKEKVVPNLHDLHPNVFHSDSNIFDLPFNCDVETTFVSKNKSSLGELLFGFFQYYTKDFDFTNHVGSVRVGSKLFSNDCQNYAKEKKISPGQWKAYVLMEEPFDRSNAGRAVCKREKFDLILKSFEAAAEALDNGKNLRYLLEENENQTEPE